jgi:hypothetical protein
MMVSPSSTRRVDALGACLQFTAPHGGVKGAGAHARDVPGSAQAAAVRGVLAGAGGPLTAGQVAAAFAGAERGRVEDLLLTLAALGQARGEGEGFVV